MRASTVATPGPSLNNALTEFNKLEFVKIEADTGNLGVLAMSCGTSEFTGALANRRV